MSYWFHRNPFKATASASFDLKLIVLDKEALKVCSELKILREKLLILFPDSNKSLETVEEALNNYLGLLQGFFTKPDGSASELYKVPRFRWTQSMLPQASHIIGDVYYELFAMCYNYGLWLMKHASMLAAKESISMDESKEVHLSLKKAAGVFEYCSTLKISYISQIEPGSDLDPNVISSLINQCTAEAQEVTIARAIELKHKPSLISGLAHETYKMFNKAGESLKLKPNKDTEKWLKYLELKSFIYLAYAFSFAGEDYLSNDKCGVAIRALKESERYKNEALNLCKVYSSLKGSGTSARPTEHPFFHNLSKIIKFSLDKCERENGFIYHQKVPIDAPILESKPTYGLATPITFTLPPVNPLWTPVAYSAFAPGVEISQDPTATSKAALNAEKPIPSVVEVPIDQTTKHPDNKSGCSLQ